MLTTADSLITYLQLVTMTVSGMKKLNKFVQKEVIKLANGYRKLC